MSTLTQLQDRTYVGLRDSIRGYIAVGSVTTWLNVAYYDINARLRLLVKQTTSTTSSTSTIPLPSDWVELEWLSVLPSSTDTVQEVVEFTDDEVYDYWRLNTLTPTRVLGRIQAENIELYPAVNSLAYTLRYVYRPTALSAGSDTPSIPEELQTKMVRYAQAQAYYAEGEIELGDRMNAMYEQGLPGPNVMGSRQRPGPFSMTPSGDYWDSVLDE